MLVLILAAGKGTRMKSKHPKVMAPVAGRPMIFYVLDLARTVGEETVVITGDGAEAVETALKESGAFFCRQPVQRGTADAVLAARNYIEKHKGNVLILAGDMPAVTEETLKKFLAEHKAPVAFISVKMKNPKGYGRVVRSANREVLQIVEEKDANETEKKINEVNTGIYCVDAGLLLERLSGIDDKNAQGEFYLTDIVKGGAEAWCATEEAEFTGVNDRIQQAEVSRTLWLKRAEAHMRNGVSIINPSEVYISHETELAPDSTLYPGVYLEGACKVEGGVTLRHGVRLVRSSIGEGTVVKENSLIEESFVGPACTVGPMAHLRPGSKLEGKNNVGNFVEMKKAVMGKGSKAGHLTYLGDTKIGTDVNIGCGTITCNYDGFKKHETLIGNDVFVGSDVQFIAPITVGDGAIIAAGATITKDVPKDALAIARAAQLNKDDMAPIIKRRKA